MRSLSESLAFQDPISDAELTVLAEEADCGRTQDGRQDLLEDTPTIDVGWAGRHRLGSG